MKHYYPLAHKITDFIWDCQDFFSKKPENLLCAGTTQFGSIARTFFCWMCELDLLDHLRINPTMKISRSKIEESKILLVNGSEIV
jgi:hypothetical protein